MYSYTQLGEIVAEDFRILMCVCGGGALVCVRVFLSVSNISL